MDTLLLEQIGRDLRQEASATIERQAKTHVSAGTEARVVRVTRHSLPVFSDFYRRRYADGRIVRRRPDSAVLTSSQPAYGSS